MMKPNKLRQMLHHHARSARRLFYSCETSGGDSSCIASLPKPHHYEELVAKVVVVIVVFEMILAIRGRSVVFVDARILVQRLQPLMVYSCSWCPFLWL